jgi:hypothetical protein
MNYGGKQRSSADAAKVTLSLMEYNDFANLAHTQSEEYLILAIYAQVAIYMRAGKEAMHHVSRVN